jgi:hypothetical protein
VVRIRLAEAESQAHIPLSARGGRQQSCRVLPREPRIGVISLNDDRDTAQLSDLDVDDLGTDLKITAIYATGADPAIVEIANGRQILARVIGGGSGVAGPVI